jgi:inhibitor of KinA sporulation pathway (predicted exonuclease)
MARQLDRVLVIDLEATCWEGGPPEGQESEIIEIGLCVLDLVDLRRLEKRIFLVRPERSEVSDFCTLLTTLTQEDVSAGIPLADACAALAREYQAGRRLWASYGDYDRLQFERECRSKGGIYPFGSGHLNVKTLFGLMHGLPREVPLNEAMEMLGLPMEGTHHRGGDDAWNIAAVLIHLVRTGRKVL